MILNIVEIIIFVLCILLSIAFLTIAERKTLGYMQRRLGPNAVGYYGLLMAIADAAKLLLKEIIIPREANGFILIISPLIALFSALLSWAIIPFGPGIVISDTQYGFLYSLAISSIGVFGTLLVGWSSNSKYSLLGSIRSTAQLISYELVLTTVILICILITSSLNITNFIEYQRVIWLVIPLFPLFIIFFISVVAETGRPPFDNIEAESELVSGALTELSAAPFVLFFLSEYGNVMFMSTLTSIFFFGGYLNFYLFTNLLSFFNLSFLLFLFEGFIYGGSLGFKANFFMFTYIWVRAAFPRLRYDLLLQFCWTVLLPLIFAILIFIPSILFAFNALPFYI